jgi:hypothetical protein
MFLMGSKAAKVGVILIIIGIGLVVTTLGYIVYESPIEYFVLYIFLAIILTIFIAGIVLLIINWKYKKKINWII